MFLDKNSVIINNVAIGQYAKSIKYGYHKLWGKDSGRNLDGEQSGTLIGIFPKITVEFRRLTKTELEALVPIFDSSVQTVTYYDPNKKQNTTIETYSNDYEIINNQIINEYQRNEPFSVAFIATKKRV